MSSVRPKRAEPSGDRKIQAAYRLPRDLADEVSHLGVTHHVRPCVIVEWALRRSLPQIGPSPEFARRPR